MSKEKPEVGDVWEVDDGCLLHITKVKDDMCEAVVTDEKEVWTIDSWWFDETSTYLGKSKVSIKELFDVNQTI